MKKFLVILAITLLYSGVSVLAQQTKLEKFAISQSVFAITGILDYAIKEAPMYPNHRPDNFFWKTAWAGITYSTSFTVNLLAVKDPKYLLGCLTEDMTYYLCRRIFHKEQFPSQFGLPFKIFGAEELPFKTVVIVWGIATTLLLIDALLD